MFRVTNRMITDSSLFNIQSQSDKILRLSEQISTGKRVNRPSDDPVGMSEILRYKTVIARNEKFTTIATKAETFLNTAEAMVGTATTIASRARELLLSQVGGTATQKTRALVASEMRQLYQQAISVGNSRIGNEYIFGGRDVITQPVGQNGNYNGDSSERFVAVDEYTSISISARASDFLSADMNPQLAAATPLSALRGGLGITAGTISITDRAGAVGTIAVTAGTTIGSLITSINGSGANVTASVAADGMSLMITDNNAGAAVTGPLTIADVGAGSAAKEMGIRGSRPAQNYFSNDLNPSLSGATLLSDLYAGAGITLSDIQLFNGAASAVVSFTGAVTVADVMTAINSSGTNSTASITASGNSLQVLSASSATVAFADDIGQGTMAQFSGLGGSRNLLSVLKSIETALIINDTASLKNLVGSADNSLSAINALRGDLGSRSKNANTILSNLDRSSFDTLTLLSNVEDTDMAKAATELTLAQVAFQATLKSSATILQPTLLDFLR